MPKKSIAIFSSLALSANAWSAPAYLPAGPNLTYGDVSNNQTIISSVTNPAAGASVFSTDKNQYRFGILSSLGVGYELGKTEDLYNKIDKTKDSYNQFIRDFDPTEFAECSGTIPDLNACNAAINNTTEIATANDVLKLAERDGYASLFASGKVPLMPFVISKEGWGGSFVLDANYSAKVNMSIIQAPLSAKIDAVEGLVTTTDTTLLLKASAVGEVGLGYGREITLNSSSGNLYGGFRAKYYSVGLERDATRIIDPSYTDSESLFKDKDYSNNLQSSSGFGVDLGAVWVAKHYRLGGWVDNINKPSFEYNKIDTSGFTDTNVIAKLSQDETYTMDPQGHIEAAVYSESKNWVLSVGADTNAVKDPVGQEYQWMTVSAAYATNSWWIPGIRVGYRANNSGTKLNYGSVGFTFFKCITLDLSKSLDSVTIDQSSMPRSAMVNLGIELSF